MSQSRFKLTKLDNAPSGEGFKGFDCDDEFLNGITKKLRAKDGSGELKAFVISDIEANNRYAGYITLQSHHLNKKDFKGKLHQHSNKIPVQLVQFVAVDKSYQGNSLGRLLLQTAFRSVIAVAELTGVTGITLESHPRAVDFYHKMGFQALSSRQAGDITLTQMYISMHEIKSSL